MEILGKMGKFAQSVAFGCTLLSLDGWNRQQGLLQEDKTDDPRHRIVEVDRRTL